MGRYSTKTRATRGAAQLIRDESHCRFKPRLRGALRCGRPVCDKRELWPIHRGAARGLVGRKCRATPTRLWRVPDSDEERERATAPGGHACSRGLFFALRRRSPQACCAYRKLTGASAVETSLELLGGKVYNSKTRHAGRLDFPSRRQDTPPAQGKLTQ